MSPGKKRAIIALVSGLLLSTALFFDAYATKANWLIVPVFPGFWVSAVTFGIHNATSAEIALVVIPVNAVFYFPFIYVALRLFGIPRRKKQA